MKDLRQILSHAPSIVTRKTGNEYVLVPVTNNIADMNSVYTLNETGAFIWELIDDKRSIADLIKEMTLEYMISEDEAERDILEFIEQLRKYLIVR